MTTDRPRPGPASIPRFDASSTITLPAPSPQLTRTFRAMASQVTMTVVDPGPRAYDALARAEAVFHDVERACSRFDPSSPLMQANARPLSWHAVPGVCFEAIEEAARAYRRTTGRFDPRVLKTLESYGYDRSLPFENGQVRVSRGSRSTQDLGRGEPDPGEPRHPWTPEFDPLTSSIRIGPEPIDLGGIGKGLAVRWALAELADEARSVLVEAGGDCAVTGNGPDGTGWLVGVENPEGGEEPLAVLRVRDTAVATSSVRLRRWMSDGQIVHHIVDPTTNRPGGAGLASVTVVDDDPAEAEVWSKVLFLEGTAHIATTADRIGAAALWITATGAIGKSPAMDQHLEWQV